MKDNIKELLYIPKMAKRKWYRVHRLVAQCFIPNPNNYKEINHKDENPSNNCVDNLEWCDRSYNINYGDRNKKVALKRNKSIIQFDKNNNFIKQYNSITEVVNLFEFDRSNIIACLKGRIPTAYGYKWKYADDELQKAN